MGIVTKNLLDYTSFNGILEKIFSQRGVGSIYNLRRKITKQMYFAILSLCLIILIGCIPQIESSMKTNKEKLAEPKATIHFIDVGQGDATLLLGPDFSVLIDAGRHDQEDVVPYLQKQGIEHLDLIVGTHPHADHIGQLDKVIKAFSVKEVWMSGETHTTQTFERVIEAIFDNDIDYYEPRAGERFEIGSLVLQVINPLELTGDFHESSISLRVTYGEISILFTGDAESQTEEAMLERQENVEAQILQLGHHGSSTSTTDRFLKSVNPQVAIYSAGENNTYGHPHREVIDRLRNFNIDVFGTIENGTIIITTDGLTFSIDPIMETNSTIETKVAEVDNSSIEVPAGPMGICVDINTASLTDLQEIVHIGQERADQLIQLRPFTSMDELTKINGISIGRLVEIKNEGKACVY